MLNAILVDDERPALTLLKLLLEQTGEVRVAGCFTNASQALAELPRIRADVAFLDIQMPGITGLELAEKMAESNARLEVVFVTAYDKYALDAFRVNALDYLLKPFSPADIQQTIVKLKKVCSLANAQQPRAGERRICCFGRLAVYGAGCQETIKWRTAKAAELFAYLLQDQGQEVPRWKIAQALWPACEEDKQLNANLYTSVYQVKKALLAADIPFCLAFQNGNYRLELPGVYVDTAEFASLTSGSLSVTRESLARYQRAFQLYKGPYLGENEYLWSQSTAEKYAVRYRRLVCALAGYFQEASDQLAAEQVLRDALAIVPLDDDLNLMLLRLFAQKGDAAALLLHYEKVRALYRRELGIAPSAAMRELHRKAQQL